MKRASEFLLLFTAIFLLFSFFACSPDADGDGKDDNGSIIEEEIKIPNAPGGVESFNFKSIKYERPSFESIKSSYEDAILAISENKISFEECMLKIKSAESAAQSFMSMYSYATIRTHINSSDAFYSEEYTVLSELHPVLVELEERLCIAAARSPDAPRYENEYFGEGLTSRYEDGGIYTERAVSLLEEEARLVASYNSLSTENVIITYRGITDTYSNFLSSICERYGQNSPEYKEAEKRCYQLYCDKVGEMSSEIFCELVRLRKRIADELGYESYTEYAYDILSHDYTAEDTERFIEDISKYAVPVYQKLSATILKNTLAKKTSPAGVVNALTRVFESSDAELYGVYSYMLYSGLFDIDTPNENRFEGSFTTYLGDFKAPFLFVTARGDASDYMTVLHEFGHFYDYYINGDEEISIDLMEVSSQAMEFLLLCRLEKELSYKDYARLFKYQMKSVLQTLVFQAFYAKFEHIVYELSEDEITIDSLSASVQEAAKSLSLNHVHYNSLSDILVTHFFNSPLYVQSYLTSLTSSLEIFFAELENEGEGMNIYKELVKREPGLDYSEHLSSVGLSSPFEENLVKLLVDKIYFTLSGAHYFDEYKSTAFIEKDYFPVA